MEIGKKIVRKTYKLLKRSHKIPVEMNEKREQSIYLETINFNFINAKWQTTCKKLLKKLFKLKIGDGFTHQNASFWKSSKWYWKQSTAIIKSINVTLDCNSSPVTKMTVRSINKFRNHYLVLKNVSRLCKSCWTYTSLVLFSLSEWSRYTITFT